VSTKAKTRAAKRRLQRQRRISLPGGGSVPMRREGLPRLHAPEKDDGPPPILEARKRMSDAPPEDTLQESDMGRCIMALSQGDDLRMLRNAWAALSAARANYRTRIIGQTGNPQGAAIAMVPEAMQTDQSLRVDLRTPEERDRDARRHWHEWEAAIKRLPTPQHKWAIKSALNGFLGEGSLWQDKAPTTSGIVAVAALRIMAGHMQGR
jgi:hypothetical protein